MEIKRNKSNLKIIFWLSIITVMYNFAEGVISIFFGAKDGTLTLLGFGIDSFVEIVSGIGILHMVIIMKNTAVKSYDKFGISALKITGTGFYLLTLGLTVGVVINLINRQKPQTTSA
jgi:hypothetical protein